MPGCSVLPSIPFILNRSLFAPAQRRLAHFRQVVDMSIPSVGAEQGGTALPRQSPAAAAAAEIPETWPQRTTKGRRDVVTAFVRRPGEDSVLLVKRSAKVRTFQLCWGGISGGVETDAESLVWRAQQEILEEVGYCQEQVTLIRQGRPLYVDQGPFHYAVHPFLFELTTAAASTPPKLNWENVDAQFFPPAALNSLQTVPQLMETLNRLVMRPGQEAAVQALANDRSHGAAELAAWVLNAMEEEVTWWRTSFSSESEGRPVLEALRDYGYHLATVRSGMAALANAAADVLALTHRDLHNRAGPFECSLREVCVAAGQAIALVRMKIAASNVQLQRRAAFLLPDGITLITISKSSSVTAAIEAALRAGKRVNAIVCESRPLYEGVDAAAAWATAGADVVVITDAQAAVFMGEADLVLVGADTVTEKGVHNKVGTHLLALAAQTAGVPVYVLADLSKVSPGPLAALAHQAPGVEKQGDEGVEENDATEVMAGWRQQGTALEAVAVVRNVYFERTPLELMKAVVTDVGVLDAQGIAAAIRERRAAYIDGFQLQI